MKTFRTPAVVPEPDMMAVETVSTKLRGRDLENTLSSPLFCVETDHYFSLINPTYREILAPYKRSLFS